MRRALVTASPESLGQAVETAVHTLVAAHYRGRINMGKAGDFFGEQVVPKLPTQALGEFSSNLGGPGAVLALDGDEAKHGYFLVYRHSAGFGFFHKENHRDHSHDRDSEQPETVNIGQHRGLPLQHALN